MAGTDQPNGNSPSLSASDIDTDDIWADDDDDTSSAGHFHQQVGELPKLEREHHNAGYLDGITAFKESYLQEGFDSGYPLGAVVGLEVGEILGTLQGLGMPQLERVAKGELSPEQLFSDKYYDEKDALARPKFNAEEGHPEVARWKAQVNSLLEKLSV